MGYLYLGKGQALTLQKVMIGIFLPALGKKVSSTYSELSGI